MRYSFILFSCITLFGYSYAQTPATAPGYYVTLKGDTFSTQIKLPKAMLGKDVILSQLLSKVAVVDRFNNTETFKPGDIKCYGFLYDGISNQFFSPACSKGFHKFLQAIILGAHTNLYIFQTVDENGRGLGAVYTLEKQTGTCIFLNTAERRMDSFKKRVSEFYAGYPEVQQLIDTKFQERSLLEVDLIEIVKAANNR